MHKLATIENTGLRLFNGLEVDRVFLEDKIKSICHYVRHVSLVLVDGKSIVALIFPQTKQLAEPDYSRTPEEGCFCPKTLPELGKCLSGCLHTMNQITRPGCARLDAAVIVNTELNVVDGTLSETGEIDRNRVLASFSNYVKNLLGDKMPVQYDYVNVKLNN